VTNLEAAERLGAIVKVWELQISSYPTAEVQAAQTTIVVLRGPDIEAMKLALEALVRDRDDR
jgi:hypothetical protein